MTVASCTDGWVQITPSSSAGATWNPLYLFSTQKQKHKNDLNKVDNKEEKLITIHTHTSHNAKMLRT